MGMYFMKYTLEEIREALSSSEYMIGDCSFKKEYGLKYAYLAGAMYKGISSVEMVVALAKAGLMGYFGSGGLALSKVEAAILSIKEKLTPDQAWGLNLLASDAANEDGIVDLCQRHNVRNIEAAAYIMITPALIRLRLSGATVDPAGKVRSRRRILAKVSRPEVAAAFLQPPPMGMVQTLVARGLLTASEAELSPGLAMADDICVEADSGGHTDRGVAYSLTPAILDMRDEAMAKHRYGQPVRVGAAGGIGTPQAAAAAFIMGADFILTGSINQCTVEAGTSTSVKEILQEIEVQDTAYAPAGDMFELGAKIQVVRRGILFPARAKKLHDLYERYDAIEQIDERTINNIEEKYFGRSVNSVWDETKSYYLNHNPSVIIECDKNPKRKMALIFKWYFVHTSRLALSGADGQRANYQIHCGPALGAFNRWVKGSRIENWQDRHVADIAERLMQGTASLLSSRLLAFAGHSRNHSVALSGDVL